MKRLCTVFLCAMCLLIAGLCGPMAQAEDALAYAPADSEVVISLNLRRIADSSLFQQILNERGGQQALARLRVFRNLTGVDLLKDVDRACIFGRMHDDASMLACLSGRFDRDKLSDLLKSNPQYSESTVQGRTVMTWYDEREKRAKYGAFLPDGALLVGNQPASLEAAFTAFDGRKGLLSTDKANLLPRDRDTGAAWAVLYRPHFNNAGRETLQARSAAGRLDVDNERLAAQLILHADSREAAENWQRLFTGGLALLQLQGDNPTVQAIATAGKVSLQGDTSVQVDLSATHQQFLALGDKRGGR